MPRKFAQIFLVTLGMFLCINSAQARRHHAVANVTTSNFSEHNPLMASVSPTVKIKPATRYHRRYYYHSKTRYARIIAYRKKIAAIKAEKHANAKAVIEKKREKKEKKSAPTEQTIAKNIPLPKVRPSETSFELTLTLSERMAMAGRGKYIIGTGISLASADPSEIINFKDSELMISKEPMMLPDDLLALIPNETYSQELLREAREYLAKTAHVGDTMARQGVDVAIGRLHPVMAVRLYRAIKEARQDILPCSYEKGGVKITVRCLYQTGVFSAYRPPGFGVGGFKNKFNSLHAVGLAVDMFGIGPAGSASAKRWFDIAARNGIYGVYGSQHRAEWNHYQLVPFLQTTPELKRTITSKGPTLLEAMWKASGIALTNFAQVQLKFTEPAPRARKYKHHGRQYAHRGRSHYTHHSKKYNRYASR